MRGLLGYSPSFRQPPRARFSLDFWAVPRLLTRLAAGCDAFFGFDFLGAFLAACFLPLAAFGALFSARPPFLGGSARKAVSASARPIAAVTSSIEAMPSTDLSIPTPE